MNDFFGKREISIIIDYTHINCEIYMMIFVQTRSHLRSKMATTGRWQSQTTMHLTHPVISTVHEESSCWNKPNADVNDDYKHPQLQNNTKRNTNAAAAIICSMASIQNYLKVLKQQTDRQTERIQAIDYYTHSILPTFRCTAPKIFTSTKLLYTSSSGSTIISLLHKHCIYNVYHFQPQYLSYHGETNSGTHNYNQTNNGILRPRSCR